MAAVDDAAPGPPPQQPPVMNVEPIATRHTWSLYSLFSKSLSLIIPLRFTLYAIFSAVLAFLVVDHAFETREQFYPAVIYLVTSKHSIIVLANLAFVAIICIGKTCKALFLGDLRENEVERVNEELRRIDFVLALLWFHEDLNSRVVSLFAMLLFSKFFHVVASERMTWFDSPESRASHLQHVRLVALLWALFLMNAQCLAIFFHSLSTNGRSVLLLFAFEYCVLELQVVKIMFRYGIHLAARRIQQVTGRPEWINRSLYLMYGKLVIDVVKLFVYIMYFILLFHYYSMPMSMVRDLIKAFLDVKREFENVVASRKLRSQINKMKTPTDEDLSRRGGICAICLEDVTPETKNTAKVLLCSHIFHINCLLSWWEKKRTCPTCSADINTMLGGIAANARAEAAAAAAAVAAAAPPPPPQQEQPQPQPPAPATPAQLPAVDVTMPSVDSSRSSRGERLGKLRLRKTSTATAHSDTGGDVNMSTPLHTLRRQTPSASPLESTAGSLLEPPPLVLSPSPLLGPLGRPPQRLFEQQQRDPSYPFAPSYPMSPEQQYLNLQQQIQLQYQQQMLQRQQQIMMSQFQSVSPSPISVSSPSTPASLNLAAAGGGGGAGAGGGGINLTGGLSFGPDGWMQRTPVVDPVVAQLQAVQGVMQQQFQQQMQQMQEAFVKELRQVTSQVMQRPLQSEPQQVSHQPSQKNDEKSKQEAAPLADVEGKNLTNNQTEVNGDDDDDDEL
jgi:E3 ubiquitin-protein ligase synoviolin